METKLSKNMLSVISIFLLTLVTIVYAAVTGVSFSSVTNGNYSNTGNFSVNWTGESETGVANYTLWRINASSGDVVGAAVINDSTRGRSYTDIAEGIWKFNISVNGTAANLTTENITVDKTNPSLSYDGTSDNNSDNVSRDWIFTNVSITETYFLNVTYSLYWSNGTLVNNTTYTTEVENINWTSLADGIYTFNVTVYDNATNKNDTSSRNITVDTTSPTVTLTLDDDTITRRGSVEATCTVSDSLDSSFDITLKITRTDDTVYSETSTGTSFTKTFKHDETAIVGDNTITCSVTDDSGNSASVTDTVTISSSSSGGSGGGSSGGSTTAKKNDTTTTNTTTNDNTGGTADTQPTVNEPVKEDPVVQPTQNETAPEEDVKASTEPGVFAKIGETLSNVVGGETPAATTLRVTGILVVVLGIAGYFVYAKYGLKFLRFFK